MRVLLFSALTWATLAAAALAQPAFPGAQGFGAETIGGRGGRVIEVTTLDDNGPGSLRAAIAAEGPRIVVFRVGGTIRLASDLKINNPNITIAGQTAPGDGIMLRDHQFVVQTDQVIVRFMRARLGDETRVETDAFTVANGHNIIIDHCSASWSVDETLSVSQHEESGPPTLDQVTVQWSIIAESLNNSLHSKGAHGYGSLVRGAGGARYSFINNLWAHHRARMPRPGNYLTINQDRLGPLIDFRNNVFYNWGGSDSGYDADENSAARYNFINNYYLPGPSTGAHPRAFREQNAGAKAYFAGNWFNGAEPADPWSLVRLEATNPGYRQAQAFEAGAVSNVPANVSYLQVLEYAGASKSRDAVDTRIVQSVREHSGALIDSQTQVGGWPTLASGEPYADADHDGMSDAWETARHLNPADASDGALADASGYTNVELFLNSFVPTQDYIVSNEENNVFPARATH